MLSMIADQLHPQFLKDAEGKQSLVLLSRVEYEQIMEVLEDLEDVRIAEERMESEGAQAVPWEQVRDELGADA